MPPLDSAVTSNKTLTVELAREICRLISPARRYVALWLLCVTLLGLSTAALAFLVGPLMRVIFGGEQLAWSPLLVNLVGSPPNLETFRQLLPWLIAALALLKALSFYGECVLRGLWVRRVSHSIRRSLLNWLDQLSLDEQLALGQGDIQQRLTIDVDRVEKWMDGSAAALLRDGFQALLLALSAPLLGGWVGLAILVIYPLLITPLLLARKRLKLAAHSDVSSVQELGRWASYVEDHLGRAHTLSAQQELHRELSYQHIKLEATQYKLSQLKGIAPSFTELGVSLVIALSLAGFISGLEAGWWSAEELMSLFVCILMLYPPVKSLSRAQQQWVLGEAAITRTLPPSERSIDPNLLLDTLRNKRGSTLLINQLQPIRGTIPIQASITLEVHPNELVVFSGPNGSGKSSLLYALAGYLPTLGSLSWRDEEGASQLVGRPPLYCSDHPSCLLNSEMRTLLADSSNLPYYLDRLGPSPSLIKRLPELIDDPRDPLALWDRFQQLSSGERQKLSLAFSFASQAKVLLLDEPESHLDRAGMEGLINLLTERAPHQIIFIASHDPQLISLATHLISLT